MESADDGFRVLDQGIEHVPYGAPVFPVHGKVGGLLHLIDRIGQVQLPVRLPANNNRSASAVQY